MWKARCDPRAPPRGVRPLGESYAVFLPASSACDYAQRAMACLRAAASAETSGEHDRWTFEAIAWHELARGARDDKGEWPTSDQQRARHLAS
jgi:hypothetical protein